MSKVARAFLHLWRRFAFLGSGLAIRLASRFIRRSDLLFLATQVVAALVRPRTCLITSLLRAFFHHVTALLGRTSQLLASFLSRLRRIQNSYRRADAQTRQKPQDCASIIVRHKASLRTTTRNRMLAPDLANYKPVATLLPVKFFLRIAICPAWYR